MSHELIIGYGSLLNGASLRRTCPSAAILTPCRVPGWRRTLDLPGPGRQTPGSQVVPMVANVHQATPSDWFNGVLIAVPAAELAGLRARERQYYLLPVLAWDAAGRQPLLTAGLWVSTQPTGVPDWRDAAQRDYLAICLTGCQALGLGFLREFLERTFVGERALSQLPELTEHGLVPASAPRPGRGRNYRLEPDAALGPYATAAVYLDELRQRVHDLISDLPAAYGNVVPEGGSNSAYYLALHMAWAEAHWWQRVTQGLSVPPATPEALSLTRDYSREEVLSALATVGERCTRPVLNGLLSGTARFQPVPQFDDAHQVLAHLTWHWIYHCGQIGLLRRLLGARYQWRFADRG